MNLLLLLLILEGLAHLLAPEQEAPRTWRSLAAYRRQRGRFVRAPLGYHADPSIWRRVPRGSPGARKDPWGEGCHVELDPRQVPTDRRTVLILGGSAAYGFGVPYDKSFTHLVGRALERDPGGVDLLNLAHPGWELDSELEVLLRVLEGLRRPPAAVVIYAGNNEIAGEWLPPQIGWRPWESLGSYRVLRRWLRPLRGPGADYDAVDLDSPQALLATVWLPRGGLQDASFWPAERELHVDHFGACLERAAGWLRRRSVPLVLVPVPVNLDFYNGRLLPQPLTYRKIPAGEQRALAGRLRRALESSPVPRLAALRALVRTEPSGAPQRWALGCSLDSARQYAEARRQLSQARNAAWGSLGALPSMARRTCALDGKGPRVIDTASWYSDERSIRFQARRLFIDACHPSAAGHRKLAGQLTTELRAVLGAGGERVERGFH